LVSDGNENDLLFEVQGKSFSGGSSITEGTTTKEKTTNTKKTEAKRLSLDPEVNGLFATTKKILK